MSKPTSGFWEMLGVALILLAYLGGLALLAWATGGR